MFERVGDLHQVFERLGDLHLVFERVGDLHLVFERLGDLHLVFERVGDLHQVFERLGDLHLVFECVGDLQLHHQDALAKLQGLMQLLEAAADVLLYGGPLAAQHVQDFLQRAHGPGDPGASGGGRDGEGCVWCVYMPVGVRVVLIGRSSWRGGV